MKNIKITKEMISTAVSLVSALICALLAGCRLCVGDLQIEFTDALSTSKTEIKEIN